MDEIPHDGRGLFFRGVKEGGWYGCRIREMKEGLWIVVRGNER